MAFCVLGALLATGGLAFNWRWVLDALGNAAQIERLAAFITKEFRDNNILCVVRKHLAIIVQQYNDRCEKSNNQPLNSIQKGLIRSRIPSALGGRLACWGIVGFRHGAIPEDCLVLVLFCVHYDVSVLIFQTFLCAVFAWMPPIPTFRTIAVFLFVFVLLEGLEFPPLVSWLKRRLILVVGQILVSVGLLNIFERIFSIRQRWRLNGWVVRSSSSKALIFIRQFLSVSFVNSGHCD